MQEIQSIVHPTDFSEASAGAFMHALKIALTAKAALTVVHVAGDRFKAKPRRDIPEEEKPTPAMRRAQAANIKKAQAAVPGPGGPAAPPPPRRGAGPGAPPPPPFLWMRGFETAGVSRFSGARRES
jgi:hypothetical protein